MAWAQHGGVPSTGDAAAVSAVLTALGDSVAMAGSPRSTPAAASCKGTKPASSVSGFPPRLGSALGFVGPVPRGEASDDLQVDGLHPWSWSTTEGTASAIPGGAAPVTVTVPSSAATFRSASWVRGSLASAADTRLCSVGSSIAFSDMGGGLELGALGQVGDCLAGRVQTHPAQVENEVVQPGVVPIDIKQEPNPLAAVPVHLLDVRQRFFLLPRFCCCITVP